ncbi:MAG: hypothetical protein FWG99_06275 [Treponema sp.]|nr:hypothetical protein [Treponema sp.]
MIGKKNYGILFFIIVIAFIFAACESSTTSGTTCPHNWSWVITKAPTATETGTETKTCTLCGKTDGTRTIPATGSGKTAISFVNLSITAPVNGATPGTTATGTGFFSKGVVTWSPADNPFRGGIAYTATVTLTANSSHTFTGLNSASINGQNAVLSNNTGGTVTLSYTFPATDTRMVTAVAIKTQPNNLTYTHGDTLDLTGLVVTLTYNDTTAEDVAAANFNAKNITAIPAHGDRLDYESHNGLGVQIKYGDLASLYTNSLAFGTTGSGFLVTLGSGTGQVTIDMYDSDGNGWDHNGALRINVNGTDIPDARLNGGSFGTYSFPVASGDVLNIYWTGNAGDYHNENAFIVYYTDMPPSPSFTPSGWNGSNALLYRVQNTLSNANLNQLLGSFTVNTLMFPYTRSEIRPEVTVRDGTTILTPTTDYTVVYTNNINVGNATVTITGRGNYTGMSDSVNFNIYPRVINFTVAPIAAQAYTGSPLTPVVTVRDGTTILTPITDYTVLYNNNTNIGTAAVSISGVGNYAGSTGSADFIINSDGAGFVIDSITTQTYTGSPLTPEVVVRFGATELTLFDDYTVTYINNTNAGTATVNISGVGSYAGSTGSVNFIINPKVITFTVGSIVPQVFTGSPLTPGVVVSDGTTELSSGYTVSYANNINAGTATVTVTGTGNYAGSTGGTTFTILQTVPVNRFEYYWVDAHDSLVTTSGGATSIIAGGTLTITAQGTGYVVKHWHLNGIDTGQSGNTYAFSGTTTGKHTVGLFVEKDGKLYNTNIMIAVVYRTVTIDMYDSFGDGWNGAALRINVNGSNLSPNATVSSGSSYDNYTFTVSVGDAVQIYLSAVGSYPSEISFIVYYSDTPPSPLHSPSGSTGSANTYGLNGWSGSNALLYRGRGSLSSSTPTTTPLGSFTVP